MRMNGKHTFEHLAGQTVVLAVKSDVTVTFHAVGTLGVNPSVGRSDGLSLLISATLERRKRWTYSFSQVFAFSATRAVDGALEPIHQL